MNRPSVSDKEYDALFDELKLLENETGFSLTTSPTKEVGYQVVSKLNKVSHSIPLLSLDKTKQTSDIIRFIEDKSCLLMLKYDGLTCECIYENGVLQQASTRGDGVVGEDITHNAKTFIDLPLTIPYDGHLKVVGEAIILKDDFESINKNLPIDEQYKTPRNLASGSVRQLDSSLCSKRKVRFAAWDVLEGLDEMKSKHHKLDKITSQFGFTEYPFKMIDSENISEEHLVEMIADLKNYADKNNIPIDGLVVKYNDVAYSKSLGSTSHHNNDGLAYKFEDETAESVLRDIEWSMGRTGQLTPVAIFDTVDLDNTDVSRASLHNISIIEQLKLGIGDVVSIAKMNMIIPQIVANKTKLNSLEIPNTCPVCGGVTKITQDTGSKILVCTNPSCKGKLLGRFTHFVSKKAMDIDGLSEATLEKFIDLGWLNKFADIYSLEKYKSEIVAMTGFGQKSYTKLMTSIEKSKTVKLENFIVALGIDNIGRTASKTISKFCLGIWSIFDGYMRRKIDWTVLNDFGSVANDALHSFYENEYNEWAYELAQIMSFAEPMKFSIGTDTTPSAVLQDKTLVITGSLTHFANRDELVSKIESLGGKCSGSVSKNTDYLINNDTQSTSGKNQKAKTLNVPVISADDFLKMIEQ